MITTLLDCRTAPAAELAAAYARRWAVETCFAELKTYLRRGRILPSCTPDLALQEIWAYLTAPILPRPRAVPEPEPGQRARPRPHRRPRGPRWHPRPAGTARKGRPGLDRGP